MQVMQKNSEGLMWVNILIPPSRDELADSSRQRRQKTIPIRWAVLQREKMDVSEHQDSGHTISEKVELSIGAQHLGGGGKGREGAQVEKEKALRRSLLAPWTTPTIKSPNTAADDASGPNEDGLCVICMERTADFELLPCRHNRFCGQCILEAICAWTRPEPPSCPLCRSAFNTMVLLN
jgi:hypothetical protein